LLVHLLLIWWLCLVERLTGLVLVWVGELWEMVGDDRGVHLVCLIS